MEQLLEVKDLKIDFHTEDGLARVVHGVSFTVREQETLGIVGESGCGKTVTALSVMRLLDTPPAHYGGGQILLRGEDLLAKNDEQMRVIRGRDAAMIFQEPMTSLNPVIPVGRQIDEALLLHLPLTKNQAARRSVELLGEVRIPNPEGVYRRYPFELSGGMRQRVMIAMAMACKPRLLIADEPTTALDVTIQAQILELMRILRDETGTAIMFITHNLGVVAEMCNRVLVMYSGEIVEEAGVDEIFARPLHPYTQGLMRSIPRPGRRKQHLPSIAGQVPLAGIVKPGCKFAERCDRATATCRTQQPPVVWAGPDHRCLCWLYEGRGAE